MKMTAEHYVVLHDAFAGIVDRIRDHRAAVIQEGRAADVDKRVRWDALHALGRTSALPERFVTTTLYAYLNDANIDAALRRIMRELAI